MFLMEYLCNPQQLTSRCMLTWKIEGNINCDHLQQAISYVHYKHKALHSIYSLDKKVSVKHGTIPNPLLQVLGVVSSIDEGITALRSVMSKTLDPTKGLLWRTALVYIENTQQVLFGCVVHHIAFDGYSEHLMAKDLTNAYMAIMGSKPATNASVISYQSNALHYHNLSSIVKELRDVPEINWPTQLSPNIFKKAIHEISEPITENYINIIDQISDQHQYSRFEVLLYFWAYSLHKITRQKNFCVGSPIQQRTTTDSQDTIGCHINMLCIHLQHQVFDYELNGLKHLRKAANKAFQNQDIPIANILRECNTTSQRSPVFQTLFALQNNPQTHLNIKGLKSSFIRQPYLDIPLELHAEIWPTQKSKDLLLTITYKPRILHNVTVQSLIHTFFEAIEHFKK